MYVGGGGVGDIWDKPLLACRNAWVATQVVLPNTKLNAYLAMARYTFDCTNERVPWGFIAAMIGIYNYISIPL